MQLAPREEKVPPPEIGQFDAEVAPVAGTLDEFWRARIQMFLPRKLP